MHFCPLQESSWNHFLARLFGVFLKNIKLLHRLADAPENSIILLEDIDAAFGSREVDAQLETAYQAHFCFGLPLWGHFFDTNLVFELAKYLFNM